MTNVENLGTTSAWQIRDFPEALRQEVIRQAKAEKVSVPEFVIGHMIALRDAGWPQPGEPGGEGAGTPRTDVSLADVERAIAMACNLAQHETKMSKGIAASARALVSRELWKLRGGKSARVIALPAPVAAPENRLQTVHPAAAE